MSTPTGSGGRCNPLLAELFQQYESELKLYISNVLFRRLRQSRRPTKPNGDGFRSEVESIYNQLYAQILARFAAGEFDCSRPSGFRNFAAVVAFRLIIDKTREAKKTQPLDPTFDQTDRAEESSDHLEVKEEIEMFLKRLTPTERHIVELKMAGRSHNDIAKSLGITEHDSRNRYWRAMRKMAPPSDGSSHGEV